MLIHSDDLNCVSTMLVIDTDTEEEQPMPVRTVMSEANILDRLHFSISTGSEDHYTEDKK